jgi:C1A family cysteine protease
MKSILFLLPFLFFSLAVFALDEVTLQARFVEYQAKYNKNYPPEEVPLRYENFVKSIERIQAKNAKSSNVVYGLNKFSDMTPEEFKSQVLMRKHSIRHHDKPVLEPKIEASAVPTSIDWRPLGAVTPVKNQEQCGSCWAFSTVENVESMWILAGKGTNMSVDLSPQQVVDCDNYDAGCNGGDPPTAYQYIIQTGGLESESSYPYHAVDQQCQFQKSKVVATISKWKYATSDRDEKTLQSNLVSWGPLSICVDAANWQDYTGGVMTAWECAWIVQLDHCVELVGYDQTASTPYWIVRNSWGTDWGESGYIRLTMFENTCGLAEEATSSVV